jgi:hypothetical protein
MNHTLNLQKLENMHQRLLSLEMALGARNFHRTQSHRPGYYHKASPDFHVILNSMTSEIEEIVHTSPITYKAQVAMIYAAVKLARDTVSGLDIHADSEWKTVVGAINTLHGTMKAYHTGTTLLGDHKLAEICSAVASGTDINKDVFIKIPHQSRNAAMLQIFKNIGNRLHHHYISYFKFLGDFGASKMMKIIRLLKQ